MRPQLITYPDSLGGDLGALRGLMAQDLDGLFSGIHILPPFPSTADRGFAPTTYETIDPRFGSWRDIEVLAGDFDIVLDVMVNHISRHSPQFQEFSKQGSSGPYANLFIKIEDVWPDGDPTPEEVSRIALRRPESPFSDITIETTGETERVWTTFGWPVSEQIDLNVASDAGKDLISGWLRQLASHGVRVVRLDAVGYVIKKRGTNCFMVEPDVYEFLGWIEEEAEDLGITLLPEIHDHPSTRARLAEHGHWTYDFVLPGLVLDAFETGQARILAAHLSSSPMKQFTTLDSHDGIPIRPDLDGILTHRAMTRLTEAVVHRGGNVSRLHSPPDDGGPDSHQLNITYYSALDEDDDRYLAARAIQLFARGVPQIYYVGLLAGINDQEAVDATGDGRSINRHDYTSAEIAARLDSPVVLALMSLIRLRNSHPAFEGHLTVDVEGQSRIGMSWESGASKCALKVDVSSGAFRVET